MPMAVPDPDVVAAGAVVLHDGCVLLVHRPKYDDWSFPKGKRDPGEHDTTTAVREVVEETGVEIRLGRPLPSQAYVLADGRTKIVHFWIGHVVGDPDVSSYAVNDEIDAVRWVPLKQAARRLTYGMDRDLLAEALDDPRETTPLIVLRHAKATSRKRWRGTDDRSRPLTDTGRCQARELVPLLAAYAVTRVVTSSSSRCTETVMPYAHEHVVGMKATPRLSEEDATAESVARQVHKLLRQPESALLCSHRPVLPWALEALGLDLAPLAIAEALVVHHHDGEIVAWERHRTS